MRSWPVVVGLLTLAAAGGAPMAAPAEPSSRLERTENTFLDTLDAVDAIAAIDSGFWRIFDGRDRAAWQHLLDEHRAELDAGLERLAAGGTSSREEAAAIAAMRKSLATLDVAVAPEGTRHHCADAPRPDLDYAGLRAALVACFVEIGNRLQFEGTVIDRGSARQRLHELEDPARRKALFVAFAPLWSAVNGDDSAGGPYRRMIAMAAADAASHGSEIDAAARAVGVDVDGLERWLTQILAAWEQTLGPAMVEPWDYSYVASEANRRLAARIPAAQLEGLNERFYRDLGADPRLLGVVYDLAPRADKSPLAYTDFLSRGRLLDGRWRPPVARVVGTYPEGGLYSLNELVHETSHAVHVSAIRTRPAFMDWPDTLFSEAFADVASWSVYEPAWQQRYLGASVPTAMSLRALFGDVMLDVAWSLFELRMLRDPRGDPNAVWTEITSRYLHIVPHPERAWWGMRVQLVESPGYMVNYGLGAVLTAELRERVAAAIGPFDAGNVRWSAWVGAHLLRFGSQRDTQALMSALLGRPLSPQALLRQVRRAAPTVAR